MAELPYHLTFTPPAPTLLGRELVWLDPENHAVRLRLMARPEFANRHGTVHGGFIAAMLDSATSTPVLASLPETLTSVTMRLETDFLKPAQLGELFAEGRIVERNDREAVSEGRLEAPDGTVVAVARARIRILERR